MTREERDKTIRILQWLHDNNFLFRSTEEDVKFATECAIEALEQEPCEDMGEVSDGYHTFNQLYHQRAILFACIVNQNKNKAWKSFKHSDGKYCFDSNGEWFIVGVDTPQGSYTYHYAKEYWDMFDCQELECGKEWDGHTEEDVTRLLSLESSDWIPVSERLPKIAGVYIVTRYYPNNVMNPNYLVGACCFDGSNTWYNDNRINHERAYADNVIAWQENPEPYKAESEVAESNRTYCTECIYFADVIYDGQQWFGARCDKDGHSTMPSMYAIKSLHNDCPLVEEVDPKESEEE